MKRAPIVIAGTAAGLAGVLSFHPQPGASTGSAASGAVGAKPTTPSSSTQTTQTTQTTAAASGATRTATGADVPNQYGDVQVRVTVSGTKLTDVTAVALPGGDGKSQEINAAAGPQLAQQALKAQSAKIDGVSGASYTSDGYKTSLQSALDKVAFKA
jgi:uncharacterized protein with FMN-binding domain